MKLRLIN